MRKNPFLPVYETGALSLDDGATIPYLLMGRGDTPIVIIPGEGDGLANVAESANKLVWFYRKRASRYQLVFLSRREPLPPNFSAEQHAEDMLQAVAQIGIGPAIWECNSSGGVIGQWVAVKQPKLVRGLILTCSFHRTHPHTRQIFEDWLGLAEQGCWEDLNWSMMLYAYRPQTIKRFRLIKSLLLRFAGTPSDPERITHLLTELLEMDNRSVLPDIVSPAIVIGGQADRIVPIEVQREMADLITSGRSKFFPGYGHAADLENPAYHAEAERFIKRALNQAI